MVVAGVLLTAGVVAVPVVASGAVAACSVSYAVTGQWNAGFQGAVSFTNNKDAALESWTLTFDFGGGQRVTQGWGGTWKQSGSTVTVTNTGWNGAVAPGAAVSTGFLASWSGANPAPTAFKVNGETCATAPGTPTPTPTSTPTPAPTPTATVPPSDSWNPPAELVRPLNEVWNHVESTYPDLYGFKNYGWDQIIANKGRVNYCVRWDSDTPVTAATRDRIHAAVKKQYAKWTGSLVENGAGYNRWPYTDVRVDIVGWAVKDRSTLQWSDDSVDVYTGILDSGGAPQCAPPCGRFFHQDGDYSRCPGGEPAHYDQSLWLTKGFQGGAGGDWGQRVGQEYFVNALDQENIHIYLHEVGHTFGLDDFYDWTPTGVSRFIMNAGSATEITPFDQWMLRDFWRHLKSRYGY
ncbi:cellulose-binding domain-containing protein [Streptomyces sp. ISL-36]|nr:cellulose-binding domain-containing protein [Streptomyces sp. ISL-36]